MPEASTAGETGLVPVESKALTVRQQKAVTIRSAIESREVQLMDVMPDGMDLKRFIRTTLIAVSQNDDLLDCTPQSIVESIFEAAEVGITPTGSLGRGYLVPLKDHGILKANFWIGYAGLIELAMRSDKVSKVWSRPVYEGDHFEVFYGTDDRIVHMPVLGETDPNKITHVYACVQYKDGAADFEVLTKAQVDGVRARARSSNNGPWVTDFAEQARKTAIRKLAKRLPLTTEAAAAIQKDEEREFGFEAKSHEADSEKRASSLKAQLLASVKTAQDAPTATESGLPPENEQPDVSVPLASTGGRTDATEAVDAEVQEVCGSHSPYGDGSHCVRGPGHKEKTCKGSDGSTWEHK